MKNTVFVLIVAATVSACGFEHSQSLAAPSAVSAPGPGPASSGALSGVWSSQSAVTIPSGTSCGNFQWRVTSETSTSIVGEFYASCAAGLVVSGVASGQLNGNNVSLQVNGTATLPGVLTCPFALTGTGQIEGDTMHLQYSGTTCLGPVQGEETLRRPEPAASEPPPPPAPAPPPPSSNPNHVGDGPLTAARAEQVVNATGNEHAGLRAPRSSDSAAIAASEELLLRIIWHLQLAGYQAGRQKNPSGAVSNDKLTIFHDGGWHAYDVFFDYGRAGVETRVIFLEVFPANPQQNSGIPD